MTSSIGPIVGSGTIVGPVTPRFLNDGPSFVDISVIPNNGSFTGTIVLERMFGDTNLWNTMKSYTAGAEDSIVVGSNGTNFRLRATAFTAGSGAVLAAYMGAAALGTIVRGTGYAASDTITLVNANAGTQAVITVDTVNGSGGVLTCHISDPGAYSVLPVGALTQDSSSGAGTGFTVVVTAWNVASLHITAAGSAYSAITIAISGGAGTATATGTLTAGAVTATSVTSSTSNYTTIPTVTAVESGLTARLGQNL